MTGIKAVTKKQQRLWQCDVCLKAAFETRDDALEHESRCRPRCGGTAAPAGEGQSGDINNNDSSNNNSSGRRSTIDKKRKGKRVVKKKKMWMCEVCKEALFDNYEHCVAHEKECAASSKYPGGTILEKSRNTDDISEGGSNFNTGGGSKTVDDDHPGGPEKSAKKRKVDNLDVAAASAKSNQQKESAGNSKPTNNNHHKARTSKKEEGRNSSESKRDELANVAAGNDEPSMKYHVTPPFPFPHHRNYFIGSHSLTGGIHGRLWQQPGVCNYQGCHNNAVKDRMMCTHHEKQMLMMMQGGENAHNVNDEGPFFRGTNHPSGRSPGTKKKFNGERGSKCVPILDGQLHYKKQVRTKKRWVQPSSDMQFHSQIQPAKGTVDGQQLAPTPNQTMMSGLAHEALKEPNNEQQLQNSELLSNTITNKIKSKEQADLTPIHTAVKESQTKMILSSIKETQTKIQTMRSSLVALGDTNATNDIVRAFKSIANASEHVFLCNLPRAYDALNNARSIIKELENRCLSNKTILGVSTKKKKSGSTVLSSKGATTKNNKQRKILTWQCDVCKERVFDGYKDCVAHEKECTAANVKGNDTQQQIMEAKKGVRKDVITWQCDFCKEQVFHNYDDCVDHEVQCMKKEKKTVSYPSSMDVEAGSSCC